MEIIYYNVIKSDVGKYINILRLRVNYKTRRRRRRLRRCGEECGWIIVVKIERIVIWKWRNKKKKLKKIIIIKSNIDCRK